MVSLLRWRAIERGNAALLLARPPPSSRFLDVARERGSKSAIGARDQVRAACRTRYETPLGNCATDPVAHAPPALPQMKRLYANLARPRCARVAEENGAGATRNGGGSGEGDTNSLSRGIRGERLAPHSMAITGHPSATEARSILPSHTRLLWLAIRRRIYRSLTRRLGHVASPVVPHDSDSMFLPKSKREASTARSKTGLTVKSYDRGCSS
jgi:hypothetical protein